MNIVHKIIYEAHIDQSFFVSVVLHKVRRGKEAIGQVNFIWYIVIKYDRFQIYSEHLSWSPLPKIMIYVSLYLYGLIIKSIDQKI